jgi:hypothetical protein
VTYVNYVGYSSEMWRFNTSTHVWESVVVNGVVPSGRYDHVMTSVTTSVGVDLWMHGGLTNSGMRGDLWRFDLSTLGWELVHDTPIIPNGPVPSPRYRHVMTSVGVDLWLHGGDTTDGDSGEGDTCS